MRTTVTLDDDVAAEIAAVRRRSGLGFKETLNAALRLGLRQLQEPSPPQAGETRSVSLGKARLPNLDNVAEVLAAVEGDGHR
jgi:hypothetical protein